LYNLYWSSSAGVTKANGTRVGVAAASYDLGGLANETTYYFVVTAANQAGESSESAEVAAFPVATNTCVATTPGSLVGCGSAVQAGAQSVILVKGALVCSGPAACQVAIDGKSVTIRGAPGATIRRIDHHDYPLFQVLNSSRAVVSDLIIDEDPSVPCTPVSATNPPVENKACASTIDMWGVSDASIDDVTIANSKSTAVTLSTGGDASVTHSRFIAPYAVGLVVGALTGSFVVADSLFWHSASNAFVLSDAHGTSQAPLRFTRNFFEHNHRADIYYTCGPQANAQCSGGQMLIYGGIDFLRIENSVFRLGSTDGNDTPVGGVEINPTNVHDLVLSGNDIHAHGMWGVYANPDPSDFARVSFVNNKLYDNGLDPDYLGVDIGNFTAGIVTESGTCHTPDCAAVPLGALWALPDRTVSWVSNDLGNPIVTVNGTTVATTANGQTIAPPGATVVLSDGPTEIDRLTAP